MGCRRIVIASVRIGATETIKVTRSIVAGRFGVEVARVRIGATETAVSRETRFTCAT